METETNALKIQNFIKETKAFEMMPQDYFKLTKNKLLKGECSVYRFDARVKGDKGWEVDIGMEGDTYATYCWYGDDEYCITSEEYFEFQLKNKYKK